MIATNQPLPPSGRDFEVYRRVKVDQWPTRAAAEEAQISQSRVCQVVAKVERFLQETTPAASEEQESRRQRTYVAEQLAAERVEAMYGRALRAFDMSVQLTPRSPKGKPCFGEQKYLMAAGRLGAMTGKLPVSAIGYGRMEEDEEVVQPETSAQEIAPPVEDCSPATAEEGVALPVLMGSIVASSLAGENCAADRNPLAERKLLMLRPTQADQPPEPAPSQPPAEGPPHDPQRQLNPQQRRARAAFLQS